MTEITNVDAEEYVIKLIEQYTDVGFVYDVLKNDKTFASSDKHAIALKAREVAQVMTSVIIGLQK